MCRRAFHEVGSSEVPDEQNETAALKIKTAAIVICARGK